jgi:DNA-binding Lrp family transcriptional regulator
MLREYQRNAGEFRAKRAYILRKKGFLRILLDDIDKKLLAALQKDAQLTAQQLSEMLHLSPSQAGRRRQRLEAEGFIKAYVARLDGIALGLSVQGFVQVHLASHGASQSREFKILVERTPEITDAWTMTGDADYLLRVYCADLPDLNRLIQDVLLNHPAVARVHSQIVMDQLKTDGALPT